MVHSHHRMRIKLIYRQKTVASHLLLSVCDCVVAYTCWKSIKPDSTSRSRDDLDKNASKGCCVLSVFLQLNRETVSSSRTSVRRRKDKRQCSHGRVTTPSDLMRQTLIFLLSSQYPKICD